MSGSCEILSQLANFGRAGGEFAPLLRTVSIRLVTTTFSRREENASRGFVFVEQPNVFINEFRDLSKWSFGYGL